MASICWLFLPTGNALKVFYDKQTDRMEVIERLIEGWKPYCNSNWISDNHENIFCPERKVKKFLDSAAFFLLYGNVENTITLHKQKRNREYEVPFMVDGYGNVSSWDVPVQEKPKREKKTWPKTRFQKIQDIRKEYPGITLMDCPVDVDGCFTADGKRFFLDHTLEAYKPVWVEGEQFFPCDKVIAGKVGDRMIFFSQSLEPLEGFVLEA